MKIVQFYAASFFMIVMTLLLADTPLMAQQLRVNGNMHHIGIGRTHARTHVILLVQDLHVRVVNAVTGELLRELLIDPAKDYQATGAPKGPTRK